MFDIALTLKDDEADELAESVKDMIDSLKESFSVFDDAELPKRAFELSVLAKLYNVLLKKEKDSDATNDTVQFGNTY